MTNSLPSLGSRLDSARGKVKRADQHLRALRLSLKQFVGRDPYAVGAEQDKSNFLVAPAVLRVTHDAVASQLLPYPFSVKPKRELIISSLDASITLTPRVVAPRMRWGLLVGEIAHNLASSLDNLVWELAQISKPSWHAPPPPTAASEQRKAYARKWNSVAFPYTKNRGDWKGNAVKCLYFVDPSLHKAIEEAQPFYAAEQSGEDAARHPLSVMHEIWNHDKHRAVNVIGTAPSYQSGTAHPPDLFPKHPELRTEVLKTFPMRAIEGTTEVAIVRVFFPYGIVFRPRLNMTVRSTFSIRILLGQGAPAEGKDVLETLTKARNNVLAILRQFD